MNHRSTLGLLLALLALRVPVLAQPAPDFWQAQSIYQIFTDRFYDGDPANNNLSGSFNATDSRKVHGGDFKGVEQKLDYIKALGATAIWLSPIVLNGNGEYHGYAGKNFYQVDPHWGTLANLQSMVNAAHARGLLVIQDVVVNHGGTLVTTTSGSSAFNYPAGYTLKYSSAANQYAAPFNTNAAFPALNSLFHNYGSISDYNSTTQTELGELSGLDDFRTELDYVRTNMVAVFNYWIQTVGFDGFRVDTVKHVEMGFWQAWCPAVHAFAATNGKPDFFMFGEIYDGSDAKCGSYTGTMGGGPFKLDSTVDFPLYFKVNSVFATASGATAQIETRYNNIAANYDPAAQSRLVTFLDNHDVPRFLNSANANGNTNRLLVALTFLHTARGIPCLYQGTEQAFDGGADPANREDMFDGAFEQRPSLGDNFNLTHPLFLHVAKLNNFRRLYRPLQLGSHVNLWSNPAGPGLFAYARRLGTQEVFVVFNTANTAQTLPNRATIVPPGATMLNLFDPDETLIVTGAGQTPLITVSGTSAKIFVAQTDWRPLDPVVVSNSPAHDAASVPTWSPIVLQFSQPMDTNSVQASFSTTPAVGGAFAWSATRDTMTFTAGGAGWPGLTTIIVRLTNSAFASASGNAMFAPYELRFKTAAPSIPDPIPPTVTITAPASGAVIAGQLQVSGSATDNFAVTKVELRLDSGPWLTATGTTAWTFGLNSSNFLNGPHQLAARAADAFGNFSPTNSVTVRFFNVPGAYGQRISGGNPSNVTNCDGNVWLKDQAYTFGDFGYSGGTTGYLGNTVIGICAGAQSLYQRERFSTAAGGFFYKFDCPAGVYETTLLEAETYWSGAGQRVFNVFIQGKQVATNLDIFTATGGINRPLTLVFTNSVTNSQLQVQFNPVVDNARVSGVAVRKIGDVFSDTDGVPDWWRLAHFSHATGQAADNSRGTDDADADGASNLNEFLAGTDPLNPASVFKITNVAVTNVTEVRLTCLTVTNRTYQLQRRDALDPSATWSAVGLPRTGTNGALTWTDAGATTNAARFYRVLAQ